MVFMHNIMYIRILDIRQNKCKQNVSDATHKAEMGTRVSDSDSSRIFIAFRLDLTWNDSRLYSTRGKGLENI